MRIKSITLALLLLPIFYLGAAPREQRIAVVDIERVFNDYYKTKIVENQLREQEANYRTYLATLNKQYTEWQEDYKKLATAAQNLTIKESERQNKSREAATLLTEMKNLELTMSNYLTEKSREFQELESAKRTDIMAEIVGEVQRRAVLDDYDMVLDHSGKTTSSLGSVVYFKSNLDITQKVLDDLNRGNVSAIKINDNSIINSSTEGK